ncbi:MAG: PepSY domain-containing protein [Terrimonas sp.]|nr:PepSY domain-containing protein [Terrimonas sp.]OJY94016.1 MAG: peptidase M4 [Sphingobacteriales bacterium 40-81]
MFNKKADQSGKNKKTNGKSAVKLITGWLHLWLGLSSGVIVLFLGITGCILAFEQEIRSITQPYLYVQEQGTPYLPPSQLKAVSEKYFDGKKAAGIEYPASNKSAVVSYWDEEENYKIVYVNPYTGEVLKAKNMRKDFFRIILDGHFYLWLPPQIGQPIVASATLIFVIMMITGLILWWPKNKAARKQRFSIKFNAKWRRVNYDLHNVLGFYMTWVCIFIALTGLVWGFEWFAKSVYFVTSAGKTLPPHEHPVSDTTAIASLKANPGDYVYTLMSDKTKPGESFGVYYPATQTDAIEGFVNHRPGTYYNADYYHYDQYTLEELPATGVYAGSFKEAGLADKIARMNYDIHVGAVLGITGKVLAFLGSLICASLPVTGFLVWRGRRKKKPKMVPEKRPAPDNGAIGLPA